MSAIRCRLPFPRPGALAQSCAGCAGRCPEALPRFLHKLSQRGQEAALLADLAVAPFPASVVEAPLMALDERHGLPEIGDYHILMAERAHAGKATHAFAKHVAESFKDLSHGVSA